MLYLNLKTLILSEDGIGKVESSITKDVPVIEAFPIFSSYHKEIEQFLHHWMGVKGNGLKS
jgi:hypothetical protein